MSHTRYQQRTRKGELVAAILAGSWRQTSFPQLHLSSAELDEVTPLLYGSGAAALGWWRLRSSHLSDCSSAEVLHQAYRLQSLQSAIHEQKIEKVFRRLREAGIEAVLAKGWAASRLYPDSALRPYGDIDLLVRPGRFHEAEALLGASDMSDCWVDLHSGFAEIGERTVDELFSRARVVQLGSEQVPLLSVEDHLALLCIHLLKHGAWRPLWLCDVGAAIESLPSEFSWDICLGSSLKRAGWIRCAIALAATLLQADRSGVPASPEGGAQEIPSWLAKSVLDQWASPFATNQPPMNHPVPFATYVRNPAGILQALRQRWPNPILATVSVNGAFNELPRLPYQMGNCALRAAQFLLQLPSRLRATQ